jgi:nicotinic acid mononucleotide adenylyltransferase
MWMQVPTSEVLGIVSVSAGVTIAALKTVNFIVSKIQPEKPAPGVDRIAMIERFLSDQQRILVDYQRENRQTLKEMRDGINTLVTLAENEKH